MSTTASIAAKGTKGTGLTENIAKRLHDNLGKTIVAIVEITSEARTENKAGDEKVKLSIGTIEVVPDDGAGIDEHVREIAKTLHYNRKLAEDGPDLELDGPAPKVADVLAAGAQHKPHPYIASTLSTDDNAPCDVCGRTESAAVHADRTALGNPFTTAEPDGEPDPDNPTYDAHDFIDDGNGTCLDCDQDEHADVHTTTPEPVPA